MNENLIPGLQRALEMVKIHIESGWDLGEFEAFLIDEIEKEKANSPKWMDPSVMPMKIIEGKAFTSLYEANQELNPTNTIFGSLANRSPV